MEAREVRAINGQISRWRRDVSHPVAEVVDFTRNLNRYKRKTRRTKIPPYLELVREKLNDVWGGEVPEILSAPQKTLCLWLYALERSLVSLEELLEGTGDRDMTELARWQNEAELYGGRFEQEVEEITLSTV